MSSQDYADLALDSYASRAVTLKGERPATIGGHKYRILDHHDNPRTGYQGSIYQRVDTNEIIVAHRGTEFDREALKDGLFADGGMVLTRSNLQATDAIALTQKALQLAQEKSNGEGGSAPPVTVTGHSLGGTLAQVTAHHFDLRGETFNAYGATSLGLRIPAGGHSVTNHVMAGDLVSAASAHYGQVKVHATPQEIQTLDAHGYDNKTHWSDPLRGRGPIQLATGFTPPTTTAAAIAMADSHKMHHFASVDAHGRPDRSVLEDPATVQRAQDNATRIGEYRRDVQGMRGVITAVGRGPVGNALDAVDALRGPLPPGEPARREREADAPSAQPSPSVTRPRAAGPVDQGPALEGQAAAGVPEQRTLAAGPELSRVSQALLSDSQREVRQLATTHHLPWDRGLDNTVCSLACCARENGLSGINLLRVNNGQIRFGQHEHGLLKDGVLDARQAANTPATESLSRLAVLDQQASLEPRNGMQAGWAQTPVHEPQLRAM
ncbi:hypothetical protein KIH07_05035 [Hydrogenophaga taeniospiralis]|uniref:hypothetical protein n=1 Tax=Hydrogenophaga taeniospiralis TaxID=65656 RepID=UPI001CFB885E|nr:hypothetical protein [Hydrogenophaga taeniospiralis]MCB4363087.1 hypothetical protein [Hydrogenophaga taeniospiralis]